MRSELSLTPSLTHVHTGLNNNPFLFTHAQKAYQDALRDLGKRAKVPGFNSGPNKRVPDQVLVNYYGAQLIKTSALELITDSAVKQAIEDAGVRAIGQAELVQDAESLVATLSPGEPLHLDVRVDIWPEVRDVTCCFALLFVQLK